MTKTYWVKIEYAVSITSATPSSPQPLEFDGFSIGPYLNGAISSSASGSPAAAAVTWPNAPVDTINDHTTSNSLPPFDANTSLAQFFQENEDNLFLSATLNDNQYYLEHATVADSYLVGSKADPTDLVGPTATTAAVTKSGTEYDATYEQTQSVSYSTYAWVKVTLPQLFSTDADSVNFNKLTPTQIALLQDPTANVTDSLGGNDTIVLPNQSVIAQYPVLAPLTTEFKTDAGNTTITAGDASYTLEGVETRGSTEGEEGKKTIDGSAGNVTVVFPGDATAYAIGYGFSTFLQNGKVNLTITSGENSDILSGITTLEFAGGQAGNTYKAADFEGLAVEKLCLDGLKLAATAFTIAAGVSDPLELLIFKENQEWISGLSDVIYAGSVSAVLHDRNKAVFVNSVKLLSDTLVDKAIGTVLTNFGASDFIQNTVKEKIEDAIDPSLQNKAGEIYDQDVAIAAGDAGKSVVAIDQDVQAALIPELGGIYSDAASDLEQSDPIINEITPTNEPDILSKAIPAPPVPITASTAPQDDLALNAEASQFTVAEGADGTLLVEDKSGAIVPSAGDTEINFTDGTGIYDPTGAAEDVARLYDATLDRNPDVAGLQYWTSEINSNTVTLATVAQAFTTSPEFTSKYSSLDNASFVNQLYQNVLGRPADAAGSQAWLSTLASGGSRGSVVLGFSQSPECINNHLSTAGDVDEAEVYRLYQAAFDRVPDAAGLNYWTSALGSGTTPLMMAQQFINSPEFRSDYGQLSAGDFVTTLYQNVLHRAPDSAGLQFWVGQLQSGVSEATVLVGFSDSQENRVLTAPATHANWVLIPS